MRNKLKKMMMGKGNREYTFDNKLKEEIMGEEHRPRKKKLRKHPAGRSFDNKLKEEVMGK